jgi:membrane associated rhomboid family serine protease
MGIQERDYYRGEGPSFLGSLSRNQICKWLIALNILVFIAQLTTLEKLGGHINLPNSGPVTDSLSLNANKVFEQGQVWRLLTHSFLHDTNYPLHIILNMILLWFAGSQVEDIYGPREFLGFYLLSALIGGLAFALTTLGTHKFAIGASGAVMGLLVLFACHYPHRTILFMMVIPMPLWLLAALYMGWDLLQFVTKTESGVAIQAHLGGGLFGFLYHHFQWRVTGWWPDFSGWRKRRARPQLRVYRGEEQEEAPTPVGVGAPNHPSMESDEHLEAKLDAVLEKMSQVGKENLTEGEREILLKAAEFYRRRRT